MPIDPSNPYVIAGVGASITAVATLLGLRWKNQHEIRLKQLEFQQKRDEQTLARKAQAAESVIKKWSLDLERLQIKQQFYEGLQNPSGVKTQDMHLVKVYEAKLDSVDKRAAKLDDEATADLYQLYLAPDISSLSDKEEQLLRSQYTHKAAYYVEQEFNDLVGEIVAIEKQRNFADEPARTAQIDAVYATKSDEIHKKIEELLISIRKEIKMIQDACFSVRDMMNNPGNLVIKARPTDKSKGPE
jgi:hypothetical protein